MHQINVHGIIIDVIRKNIKNLHLAVYPPNGRVRIAVPLQVDDDAVRLFAISKIIWIKKNQPRYKDQIRQSERKFISGESHYFKGQRYLLHVKEYSGPTKITLRSKKYIDLFIKSGLSTGQREAIMMNWYRKNLKEQLPALVEKWQQKMGVEVSSCEVKKMKTKWGTCNREARRIWINLELAKKPEYCLEYFADLMDQYLPNWRTYKNELNQLPLAHEEWNY